MSQMLNCSSTCSESGLIGTWAFAPNEAVRQQVWDLLAGIYPAKERMERRSEQRFPYPHLIYLHQIEMPETTQGRALVVVGKDISERGFGFYHRDPISHRRMIASLLTHDDHWLAFLIDLTWCRFNKHGWYDSGGRLLAVASSPMDESCNSLAGCSNGSDIKR